MNLRKQARMAIVHPNGKTEPVETLPPIQGKIDFKRPKLPNLDFSLPPVEERPQIRQDISSFTVEVGDKMMRYMPRLWDAIMTTPDDPLFAAATAERKQIDEAIAQILAIAEPYRTPALLAYAQAIVRTALSVALEEDAKEAVRRLENCGFVVRDNSGRRGAERFRLFNHDYVIAGEFFRNQQALDIVGEVRQLAIQVERNQQKLRKSSIQELVSKAGKQIEIDELIADKEGRTIISVPKHSGQRDGRTVYYSGGLVLVESRQGKIFVIAGADRLAEIAGKVAESGAYVPVDQIFEEKLIFDEWVGNVGYCYVLKQWLIEAVKKYRRDRERTDAKTAAETEARKEITEYRAKGSLSYEQFFLAKKPGTACIVYADFGKGTFYTFAAEKGESDIPWPGLVFLLKRSVKKGKELLTVVRYPERFNGLLVSFLEAREPIGEEFARSPLGKILYIGLQWAKKQYPTFTETPAEISETTPPDTPPIAG